MQTQHVKRGAAHCTSTCTRTQASSTPAQHSTAQHTCAARDQLVAVLHQRVTQGRCIALDLRSQAQAYRQCDAQSVR